VLGDISASGTIIGNTATFSNYGSPSNVGTMLIDQIISSSTNVLSVGDFNGSNAGVRMELNQSTNKVEVKNADLVVGVADSNIQSLVVTNHITASGNISSSLTGSFAGIGVNTGTANVTAGTISGSGFNIASTITGDTGSFAGIGVNTGTANVTAGTISGSGFNIASTITGNTGSFGGGLIVNGGQQLADGISVFGNVSASGDLEGGTVKAGIDGFNLFGTNFINSHSTGVRVNSGTGPVILFGNLTASGDMRATSISASGNLNVADISASGNVHVGLSTEPHIFSADLIIGGTDGAGMKIYSSHASANRAVGLNLSASSGGQQFSIALDRTSDSLCISPTTVASATVVTAPIVKMSRSGSISLSGSIQLNTGSQGSTALEFNSGQIAKFGGGNSIVAGAVVVLKADGEWDYSDASSDAASTGSLAVAMGADAATNGVLMNGFCKLKIINDGASGAIGDPVYLGTGNGRGQMTPPSASNQIVRIIGHLMSGSTDGGNAMVHFCPSPDFIKHA
jgi:hypothetical protein